LVIRFNLSKSFNYTPYLFSKKVEKTTRYRDNFFIVCGLRLFCAHIPSEEDIKAEVKLESAQKQRPVNILLNMDGGVQTGIRLV
jgi:hypothetical protein